MSEALAAARDALQGETAWLVGGAVRDRLLGRDTDDADLAQRDFTINAMAEPLEGGALIDPHHGRADLERRVVRMVSASSLAEDPLRSLRAIRFAVELDLAIDDDTA